MSLILGIDDAGRGPIIGPMILAGVLIKSEDEAELKRLGIKDSKKVAQNKREILAEKIKKKAITFQIEEKHPFEIDTHLKSGVNLNKVEALMAAAIINKINNLNKKKEKIIVVIDCPSNNIIKWHFFLMQYIEYPDNLEFKVEHKADVNYVACSAASIIAKVKREEEIEKIKKKIGTDFGSGYTSDPVTQKFLKDYASKHKKDGIFRETWQTWKNNKEGKEQKNLEGF